MKTKVLGGPGTGKTYYLKGVYRGFIKKKYKPKDITLITFRKTTANDLIAAVKPYTKLDQKEIKEHVGTIHSICLRLLGSPDVINEDDIDCFLSVYKYQKIAKKSKNAEESAYSGNLFDLYTWLRNTCTPYDQWRKYPGSNKILAPSMQVIRFLKDYDDFKKMMCIIDYSDMLQKVIDQKIPLDTPILMIDEFQDLTVQMYKIFEMWSSQCEYVYIAGDPNQSIYGFWGGSPDFFINWNAKEIILGETSRLPGQIRDFSRDFLKCNKMTAPEMKAVKADSQVIFRASYEAKLPSFTSELHLVRCNYQINPLAMKLAREGKVFSGPNNGWTEKEIDAANAIISIRTGKPAIPDQMRALMELYSKNGIYLASEVDVNKIFKFNRDRIVSGDILTNLNRKDQLFQAKLIGIMNRTCLITSEEVQNRKILTIHGAKGLEADAVFLHLQITREIKKAIMMPCEEQRAEARVWYVGITRAKKVLYLIEDKNDNYPMMDVCNYIKRGEYIWNKC
jgi:superfamily I DNA/RNA helicase